MSIPLVLQTCLNLSMSEDLHCTVRETAGNKFAVEIKCGGRQVLASEPIFRSKSSGARAIKTLLEQSLARTREHLSGGDSLVTTMLDPEPDPNGMGAVLNEGKISEIYRQLMAQ